MHAALWSSGLGLSAWVPMCTGFVGNQTLPMDRYTSFASKAPKNDDLES